MRKNSAIFYSIILILGDFLALLSAFVVAYILRVKLDDRPLVEQIPAETYLYAFLVVIPFWILVHAAIRLYQREIYSNRFDEFGRLIIGSFIGMLVVIGYDFVIDDPLFPARLVAVYGFALSFGFLVLFRMFARLIRAIFFSVGYGVTNVLLVGNYAHKSSIIPEIENISNSGRIIIGIVSKDNHPNYPAFKTFAEATKKLDKQIDSVIQTDMYKKAELNDEVMRYTQEHHILYRFVPGNNELFVGNIEVELFSGTPVVTVHQSPLNGWGSVVKRIADIIGAFAALIVFSPLMVLVAVIQKIIEPNDKILFKQMRLTQFNREYTNYKFRSMKPGLNTQTQEEAFIKMGRKDLIKKYREGGDQLKDDPRVSKFGKFLRTTSIDELPQLFNVIKGDISLVGPRALIPSELNNYSRKHNILSVKAGVTGLAQVSGRKDITFEERRKLDLYYVQNWSFWLDVTIILKTLRAVINGIGAK